MKVLYVSGAQGADYLCDMTFHGLRSVLGEDCVDVQKIYFMYQGEPPRFHSIYSLLPDIAVDRTDIVQKIRNRYFDLVVYGSIHRCQEYLEEARKTYPPSRIFMIDGEDDTNLSAHRINEVYFKRELNHEDRALLPIGFSIPQEKVRPLGTPKTRLLAPCDPRDRSTYIYYGEGGEAAYYEQYAESYFGYTMKKGGWDCARHYEIMAAGALPYFAGLEACPSQTLYFLPRAALHAARQLYDHWEAADTDRATYEALSVAVRATLLNALTTEAMAKYVLSQARLASSA